MPTGIISALFGIIAFASAALNSMPHRQNMTHTHEVSIAGGLAVASLFAVASKLMNDRSSHLTKNLDYDLAYKKRAQKYYITQNIRESRIARESRQIALERGWMSPRQAVRAIAIQRLA